VLKFFIDEHLVMGVNPPSSVFSSVSFRGEVLPAFEIYPPVQNEMRGCPAEYGDSISELKVRG
jgi:hypothetical protein